MNRCMRLTGLRRPLWQGSFTGLWFQTFGNQQKQFGLLARRCRANPGEGR